MIAPPCFKAHVGFHGVFGATEVAKGFTDGVAEEAGDEPGQRLSKVRFTAAFRSVEVREDAAEADDGHERKSAGVDEGFGAAPVFGASAAEETATDQAVGEERARPGDIHVMRGSQR